MFPEETTHTPAQSRQDDEARASVAVKENPSFRVVQKCGVFIWDLQHNPLKKTKEDS